MIHKVPLVVTRNVVVGRGRRRGQEQRGRRVRVDRRARDFVARIDGRRAAHHHLAVGLLYSAQEK